MRTSASGIASASRHASDAASSSGGCAPGRAPSRVSSTPKPRSAMKVSVAAQVVQRIQPPKRAAPSPRPRTSVNPKPIAARARFEQTNAALSSAMRASADDLPAFTPPTLRARRSDTPRSAARAPTLRSSPHRRRASAAARRVAPRTPAADRDRRRAAGVDLLAGPAGIRMVRSQRQLSQSRRRPADEIAISGGGGRVILPGSPAAF